MLPIIMAIMMHFSTWEGGSPISYNYLHGVILIVSHDAPFNTGIPGLKLLLHGTAAVESDYGYATKQIKGPALGIFQITPNTYSALNEEYLKDKPTYKDWLSGFAIKSFDTEGNLRYNVPYQVACALLIYKMKGAFNRRLDSTANRARVYKKLWNTPKGKSTVKKYIEKKRAANDIPSNP